ncbi:MULTISPECIES: S-formylglutathione hydrolase [Bordetella]|uniref:S-formylglutathione hydrolase n=1 Tax=Bordetella pertussis (strain ATCC 9797 / DSM 5571 / CCUG 30873 / LMG 14455 / NCTC 10739 / 18323) TaxID=568706 RepID=A0A0T7CTB7_BORP1|nr:MULTISPECIES: S-formylglutathione hydrolase [Bordetella]KDD57835.1 S-formylglutathione hydrolase [Bordetella bronchiseptica OSU553]AUL17649.1 S-formylglutathione hydrolase [Bordetella bronchiseptica]AWP60888.1 S-formylglutathione hydrolase [Bordetella bronchiseptica]AWQ07740.1 S-formylglutathione hydrolase [Bordetella bronchiseptica]AZR86441.1 S-formylglutathione hydrolase [Bordetella pertussis]
MAVLELVSQHRCFDGWQRYYRHASKEIGLPMRFSVFVPPQAAHGPVPVLFYLAGLTCTEETFMIKAGAQRLAAQHGVMLVAPDTSPRGAGLPGEDEHWDFGVGAGFYLDATAEPWRSHYRMYSYVVDELHGIVTGELPGDAGRVGIFGHSMGGHGALVLALRNPDKFRSVSAFAPVVAPAQVPWGHKAFERYLGPDRQAWEAYDASALMRTLRQPYPEGILVDQGLADGFLVEQLRPELFEAACRHAGQPLTLRRHEGYDHGYYFISTFIEDHIRFHVERLG